jgi:DNA repair exonuclease SbcCD ATPase subunit
MAIIRYRNLRFQNGYAYRECDVPLDQQGLVLVRGLNLDDGGGLGAGKSAVFDIFALLQYGCSGKQLRGGDRQAADDVVNRLVGKDFEAHLDLDVDQRPYELYQYRQHQQHGTRYGCLDVTSGQEILPRRARPAWVADHVLHLAKTSFFNLVYLPQEFSNVVLHGTDAERRNSLAQMFGLDIYDTLLERVKTESKRVEAILQDSKVLAQELEDLNAKLQGVVYDDLKATAREAIQQYKTALTDHQQAMATWTAASEQLQAARSRSVLLQQIRDTWQSADLTTVAASVKEVTDTVCQDLQDEVEAAERDLAHLAADRETEQRRAILHARLDAAAVARETDLVQDELAEVREQYRAAQQELPIAEQRAALRHDLLGLSEPTTALADLRQQMAQAQEDESAARLEVETAKAKLAAGVCPTCNRPFDNAGIDTAEVTEQMRAARLSLQDAQQRRRDLSASISVGERYHEARQRLDVLPKTRKVDALTVLLPTLSKQERALVAELESSQQRAKLEAALAALPKATSTEQSVLTALEQRRDVARARQTAAAKILRLRRSLRDCGTTAALEEAEAAFSAATDTLDSATAQLGPAGEVKAAALQKFNLTKEMLIRRKKIRQGLKGTETLQRDLQCYEALRYAFGSQGLKQDRFNAILADAVNTTVPQYANILWPRRTAALDLHDDGTSVRLGLRRPDGTVIDASLMSGGERHKAGIAMLLGLRDLLAQYLGVEPNVLIVDEPFGNLDPMGAKNLLKIFSQLQERFGSVFVISHRPEIFDASVWNQTWWAVRQNGIATLYRDGLPVKLQKVARRYADALIQ